MQQYKVVIAFTYRNKRDGIGRQEAACIVNARNEQEAKKEGYRLGQKDFDKVFVKSVELF